jgi:hypothetical protein
MRRQVDVKMIETQVRPAALPSAPDFPDVRFLDVSAKRFLMIDGHGSPASDPAFQAAIKTLYPVAYTLKFALKAARGVNPRVGALEGLFTIDADRAGLDPAEPDAAPPRAFDWTLMLPIAEEATDAEIATAIGDVRRRKAPPAIDLLRVEPFHEGLVAEITHVGPYSAEVPAIEHLHAAIAAAGRRPRGRHHEIYVGDPNARRRELKTIIRQPIE